MAMETPLATAGEAHTHAYTPFAPQFHLLSCPPPPGCCRRYITELPEVGHAVSAATVAQMRQDLWTDKATRAVAVDFSLYNTNTKLLTVVRIVFEYDFSSNVVTYAKTYTFPAVVLKAKTDFVRTRPAHTHTHALLVVLTRPSFLPALHRRG